MSGQIVFDGLRLIVEPLVSSLKGGVLGGIYGAALILPNKMENSVEENPTKMMILSVIWGVAEHALRAFIAAALISQTAANKKLVDRAIIFGSGFVGSAVMLQEKSIGVIGLGFTAVIFCFKLW